MLVGYMASGKSSIGRLLADSLDIDFFDLDLEIETSEGMTISDIFSEKGELFFRKKESEVLAHILKRDSFVLSTGGGTPCYGKNMENILIESTHSFYLRLSIPSLVQRIAKESHTRPLVKNILEKELPEFIGKHLFERSFFYTQAKDTINCDERTMDTIVKRIIESL